MNRFLGRGYQQYPNLRDRVAGGICFCFENLFCCPSFFRHRGKVIPSFLFSSRIPRLRFRTYSLHFARYHEKYGFGPLAQQAGFLAVYPEGGAGRKDCLRRYREREREREMDVCMYVRMSVHIYIYMRMICLCIYIYTYTCVDKGRGTEKKGDAGKQTMHDYYIA